MEGNPSSHNGKFVASNFSIKYPIRRYLETIGENVYYSKEIDFSFPVDAGVIGLVPMELMKEDYTKLGYLIQIPGEMTMEVDNKGDFKFTMNGRSFTIKTSELGDY